MRNIMYFMLVGSLYTCPRLCLFLEWWGFPPWSARLLLSSPPHWISGGENERGGPTLFSRIRRCIIYCVWNATFSFLRNPILNVSSKVKRSLLLRTVDTMITFLSWPWNSSTEPTYTTSTAVVFLLTCPDKDENRELITECSDSHWPSTLQCLRRI